MLTNPAWWFCNNWVPGFLNSKLHATPLPRNRAAAAARGVETAAAG